MRNTAMFGKVTSISISTIAGVKKYNIIIYLHEENAYRLTNKFD